LSETVRDLLLRRAHDERAGLLFDDESWAWAQVVAESAGIASALDSIRDPDRPFHVGVLLDNVPELVFAINAAALAGFAVVGLNPTRRGEALAADVRRADVQIILTERRHASLLDGLELDGVQVFDIASPEWSAMVDQHRGVGVPDIEVASDDLVMLIFTSGTSGNPKAARITHEQVAFPGIMLADRFGLGPDDVCYLSMPLFHSNAVMAGYAPALAAGATMALARRFSASGFLPDVRRFGATYANYVGKPLTYVMATPERPDDADNPLRVVFGNEAAERDIAAFAERFGCTVVDSYGSTENAIIVQRVPDMPAGALGEPLPGVKVMDPLTGEEVPAARFDDNGRLLNADEAIGELVNTEGAGFFAGYYNDPQADAERMRDGMYWSGDLAYRDTDGFVYFAGRTADWLRVDGENLAVAPIEAVLQRHPDVLQAAVYAVPDESSVGDQVMAALVLREGAELDPDGLEKFLDEQPDLGTKSWPRHVRVTESLPSTPTNKILKRVLKAEGVADHGDPVWVREARGTAYTQP
jgi:fatty-acyl-CoA synthase